MACCFCPSSTASFATSSSSGSVVFSVTFGSGFFLPSKTLSGSLFNSESISLSIETSASVATGAEPVPSVGGFLGLTSDLGFIGAGLLSSNICPISSLINPYCASKTSLNTGFKSPVINEFTASDC